MEDLIMAILSISALAFFLKYAETKRRYGENPPDAKYRRDKR